jgi:hypothetical protein
MAYTHTYEALLTTFIIVEENFCNENYASDATFAVIEWVKEWNKTATADQVISLGVFNESWAQAVMRGE